MANIFLFQVCYNWNFLAHRVFSIFSVFLGIHVNIIQCLFAIFGEAVLFSEFFGSISAHLAHWNSSQFLKCLSVSEFCSKDFYDILQSHVLDLQEYWKIHISFHNTQRTYRRILKNYMGFKCETSQVYFSYRQMLGSNISPDTGRGAQYATLSSFAPSCVSNATNVLFRLSHFQPWI